MKKKGTVFRSFVLLLLAFVMVSSCCIGAMAIGFSGNSFSGASGGSALANDSFSVYSKYAKWDLVGYRFAGIKAAGGLADEDIHSIDVILSSEASYVDTHYRLVPQWSKYEYFKTAWGGSTTATTPVNGNYDILSTANVKGWGQDAGNIFKEGNMGFKTALPMGDLSNKPDSSSKKYSELYADLAKALDAWQSQNQNINAIAEKVGFEDGLNGMVAGDTITIEPIYRITIAGDNMLLTATEAAYMGGIYIYLLSGHAHGFDSNGWRYTGAEEANAANGTENGEGTWGAIGNLTNLRFCNLLYTPDDMGLGWLDVSGPRQDDSDKRDRLKFYEILRGGWGVAICYQKADESEYDLSIESIIYKYVTLDGTEGQIEIPRGSSTVAEIPYGSTVSVWYNIKNNGSLTLYVDPYWGKNGTASTLLAEERTIGSQTYYGSNSRHFPNQSLWYYIENFTASTAGETGYYAGAVYEYGHTNAAREANPGNNYMTANYEVKYSLNVGVKQIRYVFDYLGENIEQIALNGSNTVPTFPRRAIVKVYCTFYNDGGTTVNIDGYYNIDGTRTAIDNEVNSAVNYELPAGTEKEFYIGEFQVTELGTSSLVAEVYKHDSLTATGEKDTGDNVQTSDYRVYGDVGIEVYFTDKNNNTVEPPEFWHTQEYKVWLKVTNYTPFVQYTDVYYKDTKVRGNLKLGPSGTASASTTFIVYAPKGSTLEEKLDTYSVNAAAYFAGRTTASGECNVNGYARTSNNTATKDYKIKAEVGIQDIIYKDENDVVISDPSKIKEGTKVKVYYECSNVASVDAVVKLYYNGTVYIDEAVLPAGTTGTEVFVTDFIASVEGSHEIKGEVYRVVNDPANETAEGELIPTNNVYESSYGVIYYDVEIFDIYYKETKDGPEIGVGETTTVLNYGTKYGVYYYLRNNGTEPVVINIYNGEDPNSEGVVCVTPSSYDSDGGILIQPGQQGGILAGVLEVADQQIGEKPVIGSVFIKDDEGKVLERTYDNNTCSESYVFKHNVSLDEVYLAAAGTDTRFTATNDSGRIMIPSKAKVDVHYVLTNHSGKPITVNIYNYKLVRMTTGIDEHFDITIPANGTVDVALSNQIDAATAMQIGKNYYWTGYVYRAGYDPETDPYELTFEDNSARVNFTAVETPYLEFINPNAPYREGTDVITSYYLYNPTSKAYNGIDRTASVHFTVKVKSTGEVIYETTQSTVVPSSCSAQDRAQLVYFKWSVPEDYLKDTDRFEVCAELFVSNFPDMTVSSLSNVQDYVLKDTYFTPDTEYEAKEPDGWSMPTKTPVKESVEKYWTIWEYSNGMFTQKKYAMRARLYSSNSLSLIPDSVIVTDYERYPNHWVMKSGYGVQVEALADCGLFGLRGYSTPTSDMFTWSQYSYMIWPEFYYAVDYESPTISTLVKGEDGKWTLPVFTNPDKNKVYGPVHFTPLWYPDGYYTAYACHSDIWTPLGMITVGTSDFIEIEGSAYDDWYIGHG